MNYGTANYGLAFGVNFSEYNTGYPDHLLNIYGHARDLILESKLPENKWSHIVATYNPKHLAQKWRESWIR